MNNEEYTKWLEVLKGLEKDIRKLADADYCFHCTGPDVATDIIKKVFSERSENE